MNIKIRFLNFTKTSEITRKTVYLHFLLLLNFCSRKPKNLEKRITFKYSMYSVLLRAINRHQMCIKIIFWQSVG